MQSKTTHVYQEIICPSSISRQHMSIFAKAYIWRKLVVLPWKIVKNWLYPSSHISTYITYINFSVISTYTPWEIVVSNYRNHVYPSGQKKTALEEAPLQKLRIPGQWRCRKRFDTARGSYKVVPPFDS